GNRFEHCGGAATTDSDPTAGSGATASGDYSTTCSGNNAAGPNRRDTAGRWHHVSNNRESAVSEYRREYPVDDRQTLDYRFGVLDARHHRDGNGRESDAAGYGED